MDQQLVSRPLSNIFFFFLLFFPVSAGDAGMLSARGSPQPPPGAAPVSAGNSLCPRSGSATLRNPRVQSGTPGAGLTAPRAVPGRADGESPRGCPGQESSIGVRIPGASPGDAPFQVASPAGRVGPPFAAGRPPATAQPGDPILPCRSPRGLWPEPLVAPSYRHMQA